MWCEETPAVAQVANHVKDTHLGTILYNSQGKFYKDHLSEDDTQFLDESDSDLDWDWDPSMTKFDGYIFLTYSFIVDNNWSLCIVIIGGKTRAKQYEISMSIRGDGAAVSVRGEVHSIDTDMGDILGGKGEGVLEFNKNMARKLSRATADGRQGIRVQYEIRRK